MSFINRLKNLTKRISWLSTLMNTPVCALTTLVQAKFNQNKMAKGKYKNSPFYFRGQDLTALKEVFIDAEYDFLKPYLDSKDTPVILDVGAHIGTFSLWCFHQKPKAKILSVEPDINTFAVLSKTIAENDSFQWQALNRAASKNNDMLSFMRFETSSMSNRVSTKTEDNHVQVQGITAPDLFDALVGPDGNPDCSPDKIDLIKIDIEGSEYDFITSHPDMLQKAERLVIELHPNLCDTAAIETLLKENFANIKDIKQRTSNKPLLYCYN